MKHVRLSLLSIAIGTCLFLGFQNCASSNDIQSSDSQSASTTTSPSPAPMPFVPPPVTVPTVNCSVYLTSGTSWKVPNDWNSNSNTIEAIGNGSDAGGNVRGGGGGGAYSKSVNVTLTPGILVAYSVAHAGLTLGAGNDSGDSYLCNSPSNCASLGGAAVVVGAQGGHGSTNGANLDAYGGIGGSAAAGVATGPGSVKYSGGDGGNCADPYCKYSTAPGSGGGAAGPHGAGVSGGNGAGGAGDAGYGGAGGEYGGGPGVAGTQFDGVHGSGGGGGAASDGTKGSAGGNGGTYGGGGGGGGDSYYNNSVGGGGLIVIKYLGTTCN